MKVTDRTDFLDEIRRRINYENVSYYLVSKTVIILCIFQNSEHQDMQNKFFQFVCVVHMWSCTLKEGHKLQMFENKMLRKVFGPKRAV
jgi:hypothetical protein